MDLKELAESVMPSEVFALVTYDPEAQEVGLQYGYVLLSLPREDFESFVELLVRAGERLHESEAQAKDKDKGRGKRG